MQGFLRDFCFRKKKSAALFAFGGKSHAISVYYFRSCGTLAQVKGAHPLCRLQRQRVSAAAQNYSLTPRPEPS